MIAASEMRSEKTPGSRTSDLTSSVVYVDEVVGLSAIFEEKTNVVVMRRSVSDGVLGDAARASQMPGFRRVAAVDPSVAVSELKDVLAGLPHLATDVRFWSEVLVELTGCRSVGLRLAVMDAPMCPRLHVDRVTLRLVVAYEGAGTEFVSNHQVDRSQLGHQSGGTMGDESSLLRELDCIQGANTFDVVLLKGDAWPDNEGFGAVHRSPPMAGSVARLVMTLDPL